MSVIAINTAVAAGLMLGVASLLSIGPNNIMLIREGLQRGRVFTLSTTVWTSYALLLSGAFLLADQIDAVPPVVQLLLAWMSLAALGVFALRALLAAFDAPILRRPQVQSDESRMACVPRALAVIWCNPLTYVELLLVPAALAASYASSIARVEFLGAVLVTSVLSSYGYAYGGEACAVLIRSERALRTFDAASGLLLASATVAMGVRLVAATS